MNHTGDCLEVMAQMPEASVDAIVTDPPAGIAFMSKEWDDFRRRRNPNDAGRDDVFGRTSRTGPEYGRALDNFTEWMTDVALAMKRVLKPGGYMLVWALPKTSFATGWALYRAGLEPRDGIAHIFAQGFPKSRASLKPAWEHWLLFRKPGPLRELAIDACRIPAAPGDKSEFPEGIVSPTERVFGGGNGMHGDKPRGGDRDPLGRWPANVILTDPIFDGGWDGVVGGGEASSHNSVAGDGSILETDAHSIFGNRTIHPTVVSDTGTYSRFFILPKADRAERILSDGRRSPHPTQKPEELIRHLVKLVTPAGGVVLDPFLGSGTLGVVCEDLGVDWIGIEREEQYAKWAQDRLDDHRQKGLGLTG